MDVSTPRRNRPARSLTAEITRENGAGSMGVAFLGRAMWAFGTREPAGWFLDASLGFRGRYTSSHKPLDRCSRASAFANENASDERERDALSVSCFLQRELEFLSKHPRFILLCNYSESYSLLLCNHKRLFLETTNVLQNIQMYWIRKTTEK